jgi:prepilin-type N-terminal cleavage/methylation domain-containing protein
MKGFTLIEIMVSLTIMALISGLVFVDFRSSNQDLALERSARKLAQDVRRTAELAIQTGQVFSCASPRLPSGYGIFFNQAAGGNTFYIIYGNCAQTTEKKEGYDGGSFDKIIETVTLEKPVQIESVDGTLQNSQPLDNDSWSVLFVPPDPQAVLCKNDSCSGNNELLGDATITLSLVGDISKTKIIQVNEVGFADVN